MSRTISLTARVLGGLPVIVEAAIYPAEPDVGINHDQIEITEICWASGKCKPVPDSVFNRIDQAALQDEILESLSDWEDYYD